MHCLVYSWNIYILVYPLVLNFKMVINVTLLQLLLNYINKLARVITVSGSGLFACLSILFLLSSRAIFACLYLSITPFLSFNLCLSFPFYYSFPACMFLPVYLLVLLLFLPVCLSVSFFTPSRLVYLPLYCSFLLVYLCQSVPSYYDFPACLYLSSTRFMSVCTFLVLLSCLSEPL